VSGRKIAFFDFDGTITTKDTLLEFIKFLKGKAAFYTGFLIYAPWLLAYKMNFYSNDLVKQKILTYFFSGMPERIFQEKCDLFIKIRLPELIRPAALAEISKLKEMGFEIVVISASAGNWISNWTSSHAMKLISTKLEVKNGFLTGKIEGKNCHGEQKVACILEQWRLDEYQEIYAYGDSSGDKPMLALATKPFYKPFRTS
jgi:HAD superfamily hydrolase (TIGR01490 family)